MRRFLTSAALGWLLAGPGLAQFRQYIPPGGLAQRPENRKERLENAVSRARWKLGPLRLDPWVGLKDASYVDNSFGSSTDEEADITATVGAGLKAYLPLGSKATLVAHALPEYVWWKDQTDRRQLTGRYGVGLFGYFNRLTVEATATSAETQGFVTPETEQLVVSRANTADLGIELALGGSVSVFASGTHSETRNLLGEPDIPELAPFDLLNRDEDVYRLTLRRHFSERSFIGVGVERSQVDFLDPSLDRSNSGEAPVLEVQLEGARVVLFADLARRQLDPDGGSGFVPYDATTGNVLLGFGRGSRLTYDLFAGRTLVYSFTDDYAYFQDDRLGVRLAFAASRRVDLIASLETGDEEYALLDPAASPRIDDTTAWSAALTVHLAGRATMVLGARVEDFDSNLDAFDRSVTLVQFALSLGGRSVSPWF